jgi:hypothetical protein
MAAVHFSAIMVVVIKIIKERSDYCHLYTTQPLFYGKKNLSSPENGINHSILILFLRNNYLAVNILLTGQSFNENLLYLSPVLKKVYYY